LSFLQFYNDKKIKSLAVLPFHSIFSSEFLYSLPFQSCPLWVLIRTKQSAMFHYDRKITVRNNANSLLPAMLVKMSKELASGQWVKVLMPYLIWRHDNQHQHT